MVGFSTRAGQSDDPTTLAHRARAGSKRASLGLETGPDERRALSVHAFQQQLPVASRGSAGEAGTAQRENVRRAARAADFFGSASDAQPALVVVKALDVPFASTVEGGFLVSDGTDYGSFEHPGTNLMQEMSCIDLVVCSVLRNSAAMPLPSTKVSFSSAFGFREQHFLGAAVCSALVRFFSGANAAAQMPSQRRLGHGPLFAAELHVSTLQWVNQFEGNVASGNRIAKLDVEDSVRVAAFGGAARFGCSRFSLY